MTIPAPPYAEPTPEAGSPPWSPTTRRIVAALALVLVGVLLWRFQSLIVQIVVAWLVAYLLNPAIAWVMRRTPLQRGLATLLVFLLLILVLLGVLALIGVAVFNQLESLIDVLPGLWDRALEYVTDLTNTQRGVTIGPLELSVEDLQQINIIQELTRLLDPALRTGSQAAGAFARGTVGVLGWLILTFTISIYIAIDMPRLGRQVALMVLESGYRDDFTRIGAELLKIGNAYLRGQAILGIVVGTVTGVGLAALGVRNALALGLLAGLLEFIPYFGPIISAAIALVVAFFQSGSYLGLSQVGLTLAVLAVMVAVQQLEGTFLVPRVMGDALDLKPLTVIIAVIIGGALAGILGIILAAPAAAAIRLVGSYVWRKLLGLPPFPEDEPPIGDRRRESSLLGRSLARLRRQPSPDDSSDGIPPRAAE